MKWYKLWEKKEPRVYVIRSWLMPKFLLSGFTPGPFMIIRQGKENDNALIYHEKRHLYHWDRDGVHYPINYLTNSAVRLDYEVDAYAHQATQYHPKLVEQKICIFGYFLKNNYRLNIDIITAENLIRDKYREIIKSNSSNE